MLRPYSFFIACLLAVCALAQEFVSVQGTQFVRDGKPYYFVGTNFWYGPILASQGQGGNRQRLAAELDALKALGIDNLRILVGADAGSKNVTSLTPYLQPEPGMLNDTLLDGLDYLLREMERRDMVGVFYLTNSWDWSGGYGFYLKNTGHGDSPDAHGDGYNAYCAYAAHFYAEPRALQLYYDYVRRIVSRRNRYTGRLYRDEPAIMAWQLCNEPRPFAAEMKEPMLRWSQEAARIIKDLDPNHLVSTGSEGTIGCLYDEDVCLRMHNDPNIDYLTVHVWPVNWGWASRDRLYDSLPNVYVKANEYLAVNRRIAERIDKPMVIEEFGYSRDHNRYTPNYGTRARDAFYGYVFAQVAQSYAEGGPLAGCNFWGWGGSGRPANEAWHAGDDLLCDPPHEPQGWYSVFDCDSTTLNLIRTANAQLSPATP